MLTLPVVLVALLAISLTRGGAGRRLTAAALPLTVLLLAQPPEIPWPGGVAGTLESDASIAAVERHLAEVPTRQPVRVSGDGLHPDLWSLLADRTIEWQRPTEQLGLVALSWPRRAVVGQAITVKGTLDTTDSLDLVLSHPDGRSDSLIVADSFTVEITPVAPGRWRWHFELAGVKHPVGVMVVEPPSLRVLIIAARPDFEIPALARRLRSQGASVTVRTRLTATRVRTEQFGPLPPSIDPSPQFDSLDLLVLGEGALAEVSSTQKSDLLAALGGGLGLLHLVRTTRDSSTLSPFDIQSEGEVERPVDLGYGGVVPVAPITVTELGGYLHATDGTALAWQQEVGSGTVGISKVSAPSHLALAGESEAEARFWADLLGPLLRRPIKSWSVDEDAVVAVGEPIRITRHGEAPSVTLSEAGVSGSAKMSGDSLGATLRLWPTSTGWMTVISSDDTLHLDVTATEVARSRLSASRRNAAEARVGGPAEGDPPARFGRRTLPAGLGWGLLILVSILTWKRQDATDPGDEDP